MVEKGSDEQGVEVGHHKRGQVWVIEKDIGYLVPNEGQAGSREFMSS